MTNIRTDWKKRTILFFISQCITLFGSQIVQFAIVWYVTLRTGSGAWVAAFSLCAYLPQFFVAFIGGVWADRFDRKRLIIGADLLIAAVTLAMLLLMPHMTDEQTLLTGLLVISVIRSAGAGIQQPAVNAVIPQLVPEEQLMRWNGINATMQSVVQFAAPAAAALALNAGDLRATLLIDAITAAGGIGMFACIAIPRQKPAAKQTAMLADMGEGLRYAIGRKAVRRMLIIYGLFLFWSVPAGYLAGLYVSRTYGDTYWYLTAVELIGFGGMMMGGLLMSVWGGFRNRSITLAAGLALFGITAIAMGMSRQFLLYLILMAVYGIALTAVQTAITTMIQENTEGEMQGRIFGLMSSIYASCYPVGMAVFGPAADAVPMQGLMVLSGVVLIIVACAAGVGAGVMRREK